MDEVQELREEVERLRSRLRVLAWSAAVAIAAVAGLVGAMLVGGDDGPRDEVTARSFRLVGEDGTIRGTWTTTGLGDARFELAESAGRPRLALSAADEHATVELTDAGRRTLARLTAVGDGTGFRLAHADGHQVARMRVSTDGATLSLDDHDASLSAGLRAAVEGTDLQLARLPEGGIPRALRLGAGPADPAEGPALRLLRSEDYAELAVDDEPRLVLAGETRLASATAPGAPLWSRIVPEPEGAAP